MAVEKSSRKCTQNLRTLVISPNVAAVALPLPAVGFPFHALQADAVVGRVLVRRRPDAHRVAGLEEVLRDAGALELRHADPFSGVNLFAERTSFRSLHHEPHVRVSVLEFD